MSKKVKNKKSKGLEKEYLPSLKIHIVSEIELGNVSIKEARRIYRITDTATILYWLKEYGNQFKDQF